MKTRAPKLPLKLMSIGKPDELNLVFEASRGTGTAHTA